MTRARDVANVLSTATALATDTETAAAISSHNSATTSVHGITNTATLATQTYADSAVSTHAAAADPHTGYVLESLFDAKGDLISASADNTPAKLTAGSDGSSLLADSSTTTGLRYSGIAGANLLANGSFDIWQRGTSGFSSNQAYSADRWFTYSRTTATISQETSVVPTGATNALKVNVTALNGFANLQYAMEQDDVIKLRGQVVTFSAYLRADATYNGSFNMSIQSNTTGNTQTGGTWSTVSGASTSHTPSTSAFTRVSVTGTIPTNANGLAFYIGQNATLANNSNYYIALAKAEIGSVATPWSRAGVTLANELSACQRYFQRFNSELIGRPEQIDVANRPEFMIYYNTKRISPTITVTNPTSIAWYQLTSSTSVNTDSFGGTYVGTSINSALLFFTTTSGISAYTAWQPIVNGSFSIDVSAEL